MLGGQVHPGTEKVWRWDPSRVGACVRQEMGRQVKKIVKSDTSNHGSSWLKPVCPIFSLQLLWHVFLYNSSEIKAKIGEERRGGGRGSALEMCLVLHCTLIKRELWQPEETNYWHGTGMLRFAKRSSEVRRLLWLEYRKPRRWTWCVQS